LSRANHRGLAAAVLIGGFPLPALAKPGSIAPRGSRFRAVHLGTLARALFIALCALAAAGCDSLGPTSVPRDRINYAGAMADSWKQQTLLNVVRLRYADTPTFMDISSVIASYAYLTNVAAGASVNVGVPLDTTTLPKGGATAAVAVSYLERPTISYTPLTGDRFTRSLLRPIPPAAIFTLIAAGYPADFLLQVTVRSLNGVYNLSSSGGAVRPADPAFYELLDALRRIQLSGSLNLRIEEQAKGTTLSVLLGGRSAEIREDVAFVQRTLNLATGGEVVLTSGAVQGKPNELAVLSRSMLEILNELAARIDVPPEHAAEGRTFMNVDLGANSMLRDRPIVRIEAGPSAPAHSYAAVQYQGTWYWIDDRDYDSKNAFTYLLLFFALAETGVQSQAPILTLPVQ